MIVSGNIDLLLTRPSSFKLNLLDNFGNPKAFHTFNLNLEQLICKKLLKFVLLGNLEQK